MEISELRPYAKTVMDNLRLITASKEEAQIREEEEEREQGQDDDDDDDNDGDDGGDYDGAGHAGGRASLARGRERRMARGGSLSQGGARLRS